MDRRRGVIFNAIKRNLRNDLSRFFFTSSEFCFS